MIIVFFVYSERKMSSRTLKILSLVKNTIDKDVATAVDSANYTGIFSIILVKLYVFVINLFYKIETYLKCKK